ncbi:MAG: hypothetical protein JSW27_17795, partial [Phycisphaerales bacterium]
AKQSQFPPFSGRKRGSGAKTKPIWATGTATVSDLKPQIVGREPTDMRVLIRAKQTQFLQGQDGGKILRRL